MTLPRGLTKTARQLALEVLNKFDITRHNADEILHKLIDRTMQKAHATDLVFGVIRNRSIIDLVITKAAGVPKENIDKNLLNILRIGAYELIFTPQTADYAIVNEAANQARGRKATGFVNVVLRNITRDITDRTTNLTDADPSRTIPQSQTNGCRFEKTILPDPQSNPAEYLSKAFSLPKWLIDEWIVQFGFQQTRKICFGSNRRPGIYIHPNTLKVSAQALAEMFKDEGVDFEILPDETMIKLKSHQPISSLKGFAEGFFIVQDPTAAKAVDTLAPRPGWFVVDLCAAPGGKTVQMAQLMENTGKIIATDIDSRRLKMVDQNCKRLGITIVKTLQYDDFLAATADITDCDAVLLDVPCSNSGVLARRCEVRLRINPQAVNKLAEIQVQLLQQAAGMLKNSGKLCYSTCSILKQENTDVIRRFLSDDPGFKLSTEKLTLPSPANDTSFDCDGGYVAVIEKCLENTSQ